MNVYVDRNKIKTVGYKAIGEFLKVMHVYQKQQIYKSTANVKDGLSFF